MRMLCSGDIVLTVVERVFLKFFSGCCNNENDYLSIWNLV